MPTNIHNCTMATDTFTTTINKLTCKHNMFRDAFTITLTITRDCVRSIIVL
jgi:hypothetical protein